MPGFLLNDRPVVLAEVPGRLLLDYLRETARLAAAKPGCRAGDCGACSVLLGQWDGEAVRYQAVNSCLLPLGEAAGRHVVTLEGLNSEASTPVQQAFVDAGAIQCGYCTPGLIIAVTGYFLEGARPDLDAALEAVAGNLCRCTGYAGIRRALDALVAAADWPEEAPAERLQRLLEGGWLPPHFATAAQRLLALPSDVEPAGETSVPVGGGTDLFAEHARRLEGRTLLFLDRRAALQGVWLEGNRCFIGAGTTLEAIRNAPLLQRDFPGLLHDFAQIASTPIRHRATLGGNLAHASPIADAAVYFLALPASLGLRRGRALREIALEDFHLDYKRAALADGEEIEWLSFELPLKPHALSYEKIARRPHLDIAAVNSALGLEWEGDTLVAARLSAGGVAPTPRLLRRASDFLIGRRIDAATVEATARLAMQDIAPIDDIRGSAEYKRLLVGQLVRAHFFKLFPSSSHFGPIVSQSPDAKTAPPTPSPGRRGNRTASAR